MELELKPLALPGIPEERPIVIAGPCSAETEEQVMNTATALANKGVKISVPVFGSRAPSRVVSKV